MNWTDHHIPRTINPVRFYPALFFWKKLAAPERQRSMIRRNPHWPT